MSQELDLIVAALSITQIDPELWRDARDPLTRLEAFELYRQTMEEKRIVLLSMEDWETTKVVKPQDNSRYYPKGRRKIKGKIYGRLGTWANVPALMLTLTYDPKRKTKDQAWHDVGPDRRRCINTLDQYRRDNGAAKLKYLCIIEEQKRTGYPHLHIIFPNLKYIAPFNEILRAWGQGGCMITQRDNMSPTSYVCKYITKMDGWSEDAQAYLWYYHIRLYSMSVDYNMPRLADKPAPKWRFMKAITVYDLEPTTPLSPEAEALPPPLVSSLN
jgi:hypothetical protein